MHVWDVGQLTGSLPGLYPLTRTGLLTVHDPGNLEGLLDELSDRIRRVHTRVLVDGHPSSQALARDGDSGPSRGSSRCSSATGAPLARRSGARSSGCCAAGLACGISVVLVDVPHDHRRAVETVRLHEVPAGTGHATVAAPR